LYSIDQQNPYLNEQPKGCFLLPGTEEPAILKAGAIAMARLTTSKGKGTLPETLDRVVRNRERVIVRRRGKEIAAIVPMEDLAALEEMEDRRDAQDFRSAKRQWQREGKKTVPWERLREELGL